MAANPKSGGYRPTEAKYKGGAVERYVTYDLAQESRGGHATYPKVKRVYIAGDITGWQVGTFRKRSGREARGVKVDYRQTRAGYHRHGYTAQRGGRSVQVPAADVPPSTAKFSQVVEVPENARNVQFHDRELPATYRQALQDVR